MRRFNLLVVAILIGHFSQAQNYSNIDTGKKKTDKKNLISVEQVPEFPGGINGFSKYIEKNLKYPEVALLINMSGKLTVSFTVERDGKVTDVAPQNCIGAGCEAEAVRLLEMSPSWKPGLQDGRLVRVRYSVPINFSMGEENAKVRIKRLRRSDYGFVFNIRGGLYTIDEAEKILGSSFMSDQIEIAEPFFNYNKVEKFDMPAKKEVYLLIFKST